MQPPFFVHAEWDPEARVWVTTSEAVPGLATEAATIEALIVKLKDLIPELLDANGVEHEAPAAFELLTRRYESTA